MNTIHIFLASSAELENDRKDFEIFFGRENNIYNPNGIKLQLHIWEDFIDAMSATRLQDEYNKTIEGCDIFIMLFCTKVGIYTAAEFEKAFRQFRETNKPLIYTYFKDVDMKLGKIDQKDIRSLWDFQEKLKSLGHFPTEYENTDRLTSHFRGQLDKLFAKNHFGFLPIEKSIEPKEPTPQIQCLSAGQPYVPQSFIGRDVELADIRQKLQKNRMLLIHAEGGMGKTTLAAKHLEDNIGTYKCFAWLFCDNGINEQIKTLALPLKVDLTLYKEEDQQLLALKTAMQNLGKDCLLILDNANEPEHIKAFQQKFGGLPWQVLLTSRCKDVLAKENEYSLNHLSAEQAKALFKANHNENTPAFETLLDQFLMAIGYNTLMIELFSKNLYELSAFGDTLADALQQFQEKGLFLGKKSFEIATAYTGNVHRKAATTDEIIEILYDLTSLEETERKLLVNLALLPAESNLLTLLIEVLTPENKFDFAKQLKVLAQKGWLDSDTTSYRMSPVVQQIVLAKNKDTVWDDAAILVYNLNKKLENDGSGSLVNLKTYKEAQPFAELAESVAHFLHENAFDTALLLLNLSDYYKAVGIFKKALGQINRAAPVFEMIDKENYGVCIERLGTIYQDLGDFKKALIFFELYLNLSREFFEADLHSEQSKSRLSGSYERLGYIYLKQRDFKEALKLFEVSTQLNKELFEANPHSEQLKNQLAISFEKIGDNYQQQGNLEKAMAFIKLYNNFQKELFESNQESVNLYNGLAISYANLGEIHKKIKEQDKAKNYFQQAQKIYLQLTEAVPEIVEYKNNLEWVQKELENM